MDARTNGRTLARVPYYISPRSLGVWWANKGARVVTTLFIDVYRRSSAAYSEVGNELLRKFKPVQEFIIAFVTSKNGEEPSKNEGTRVVITFLPFKVYGDFSRRSRAAYSSVPGRILQNYEPMRDKTIVLITCKFKEEPIKMKELEMSQDSPFITLLNLSVSMETRVLIRSSPKPYVTNPSPQWWSWWNLILYGQLVSEIFMSVSVRARVPSYKLILEPKA